MKALKNRLSKLEQRHYPDRITEIDIVIVSCKDQIENPNNYKRVLESEEISETGFTRKIYHLESKG